MARMPPTGSVCRRLQTEPTDTPNARAIAATATEPETVLLTRRPIVALKRKPRKGNSGISSSRTQSPLERSKVVRIQGFAMTKERDDDRQAHRRLGGRDGHDEEHDDLPVDRSHRPRRGD